VKIQSQTCKPGNTFTFMRMKMHSFTISHHYNSAILKEKLLFSYGTVWCSHIWSCAV